MKKTNMLRVLIPAGMVLTAIFLLAGCASKKNIWGDTKKGLVLNYRMIEGTPYAYKVKSDVLQEMEINQQKLSVVMNSIQEYTFTSGSSATDPLQLNVTIDTMALYIKTPMNEMEPGMENVIGKSLTMDLSAQGYESNMQGAKEITYAIGPETRNLGSEFQGFFPNLPSGPIQPGDTWSYQDTVMEESGGNWLGIYATNHATLSGYESLGNRECALITIDVTGTIRGKGTTQGVDTETAGDFSGTDQVWFDYKEGVLVKIVSKGTAKSQTQTSSVRQMIIPATRTMTKEVELIN